MREHFSPHHGHHVKCGRRAPLTIGPHLKLGRYLRASLPAIPDTVDYSAKAAPVLADIMGNDTLRDCVIAAGAHIAGVVTGNASGQPFHAALASIIAQYSAIGGYVPGNEATDQGCDEIAALNYWQQHGMLNGTKILGWLRVDESNPAEVRAALYYFENLLFGMALPEPWVAPFPSGPGFRWDVAGAPVDANGHAVMATGFKPGIIDIDSWGMGGEITDAAVAKYCAASAGGGLYVMITPDQLLTGQAKAPNGISWVDLIADFDALGGHLPVPTPAPAPAPESPPAMVSLTDAIAWAQSRLMQGPWLCSRTTAAAEVAQGLTEMWPKS